jgi:hypothetical protein
VFKIPPLRLRSAPLSEEIICQGKLSNFKGRHYDPRFRCDRPLL